LNDDLLIERLSRGRTVPILAANNLAIIRELVSTRKMIGLVVSWNRIIGDWWKSVTLRNVEFSAVEVGLKWRKEPPISKRAENFVKHLKAACKGEYGLKFDKRGHPLKQE
jgi:hypothetical protein